MVCTKCFTLLFFLVQNLHGLMKASRETFSNTHSLSPSVMVLQIKMSNNLLCHYWSGICVCVTQNSFTKFSSLRTLQKKLKWIFSASCIEVLKSCFLHLMLFWYSYFMVVKAWLVPPYSCPTPPNSQLLAFRRRQPHWKFKEKLF